MGGNWIEKYIVAHSLVDKANDHLKTTLFVMTYMWFIEKNNICKK